MTKPVPIDFGEVLSMSIMKKELMHSTLEMRVVNSVFKGEEPEDIEEITYIGFKNLVVLVRGSILNGKVTTEITIKQDTSIQDMLPELNQDARVDFARCDYFGEVLVRL